MICFQHKKSYIDRDSKSYWVKVYDCHVLIQQLLSITFCTSQLREQVETAQTVQTAQTIASSTVVRPRWPTSVCVGRKWILTSLASVSQIGALFETKSIV